jgi:hypothetical protein
MLPYFHDFLKITKFRKNLKKTQKSQKTLFLRHKMVFRTKKRKTHLVSSKQRKCAAGFLGGFTILCPAPKKRGARHANSKS